MGNNALNLESSLNVVLPCLLPPLASQKTLERLKTIARKLPPVAWAGFEHRLEYDDGQVDFHQGLRLERGDPALYVKYLEKILKTKQQDLSPAWFRILDFLSQWSEPDSAYGEQIDHCILEFDVGVESDYQLSPSVFVGLRANITPQETYAVTQDVLNHFWVQPSKLMLKPNLEACFRALPKNVHLSHVGIMLSRELEAIRINIRPLKQQQLRLYLQSIGWPHPTTNIESLFAELVRYVDQITVCLDVGTQIYPRIGLECSFKRQPALEPRYGKIFDFLVNQKLCSQEKANALLVWAGETNPINSMKPWPEHFLGESLFRNQTEFSIFDRTLNHIKIDYWPDRPMKAKAYSGFDHKWIKLKCNDLEKTKHSATASQTIPFRDRIDMDRIDEAMVAAISYLSLVRNQGGWWRDYDEFSEGASDEWVTTFVGYCLSTIPNEDAIIMAMETWDLLARCDRPSGGWGWNRWVPPDAESTIWALRLASQLGKNELERVMWGYQFLRSQLQDDGGIASYNEDYFPRFSGRSDTMPATTSWFRSHVCVTAAAGNLPPLTRPTHRYLRNAQQVDGSFLAYWWPDSELSTALAAEALFMNNLTADKQRIQKSVEWVVQRFDSDGAIFSKVARQKSVFATAWGLRLLALGEAKPQFRNQLCKAVSWLLSQQSQDGSWPASAYLLGQGKNNPKAIVLDKNCVQTTATTLLALNCSKNFIEDYR